MPHRQPGPPTQMCLVGRESRGEHECDGNAKHLIVTDDEEMNKSGNKWDGWPGSHVICRYAMLRAWGCNCKLAVRSLRSFLGQWPGKCLCYAMYTHSDLGNAGY